MKYLKYIGIFIGALIGTIIGNVLFMPPAHKQPVSKYVIMSSSGTYYTDDLNESNGCLYFRDEKNYKKNIQVCGAYSIIINYKDE